MSEARYCASVIPAGSPRPYITFSASDRLWSASYASGDICCGAACADAAATAASTMPTAMVAMVTRVVIAVPPFLCASCAHHLTRRYAGTRQRETGEAAGFERRRPTREPAERLEFDRRPAWRRVRRGNERRASDRSSRGSTEPSWG